MRIGLKGSKHVYLGLHSSEVDAAKVYDRALVLLTGQAAATNFPSMQYTTELAAHEECAPACTRAVLNPGSPACMPCILGPTLAGGWASPACTRAVLTLKHLHACLA